MDSSQDVQKAKSTGFPQVFHSPYILCTGTRMGHDRWERISTAAFGPVGNVPKRIPPGAFALTAGEGGRNRSEKSGATRKEAGCDIRGFDVPALTCALNRLVREARKFEVYRVLEVTAPYATPALPNCP